MFAVVIFLNKFSTVKRGRINLHRWSSLLNLLSVYAAVTLYCLINLQLWSYWHSLHLPLCRNGSMADTRDCGKFLFTVEIWNSKDWNRLSKLLSDPTLSVCADTTIMFDQYIVGCLAAEPLEIKPFVMISLKNVMSWKWIRYLYRHSVWVTILQ